MYPDTSDTIVGAPVGRRSAWHVAWEMKTSVHPANYLTIEIMTIGNLYCTSFRRGTLVLVNKIINRVYLEWHICR